MINNMKRYRKIKGLTQLQLADKCQLDYHTVTDVENGRRNPSLLTAMLIAKELGVTVDDLWVNIK